MILTGKRIAQLVAFIMVVSFSASAYASEYVAPTKTDKCAVCGMFAYKYQNWIAEIVFRDNSYAVFDGPKDMLKYFLNISRYNKTKTKKDIAAVYVTEYYSTKVLNAKDVFFVTGSDVYGPMGKELIPVSGMDATQVFSQDHDGKKILAFDEITAADIPGIQMGHGHQEHNGMHH